MLDLSRDEAEKDIVRCRDDAKQVIDRIYAIREGEDVPEDDATSAAVSILRWADNNKRWSRSHKKSRK